MAMQSSYDTIVIGAGLGGLSVAAILAQKEGQKVLVVEKETSAGGRAHHFKGSEIQTQEDYLGPLAASAGWLSRSEPDLQTILDDKLLDGYSFELGMHDIVNGTQSRMCHILESLGVHIEIVPLKACGFWSGGELHAMQRGSLPWLGTDEYMEMRGILAEMRNMTIDEVRSHHRESLWDYLQPRTQNATVLEFFDVLGGLTVGMNSARDLSAGDFILDTRMPMAAGLHFADGTLGQMGGESFMQIAFDLIDVIRSKGGEVRLGQGVESLILDGGTIAGVRTADGSAPSEEIFAPTVVCNVPVKGALKSGLLPRDELPDDFVDKVERLEASGAITPIFGLSRSVTDIPGFIMTRVPVDHPAFPDGIVMAYEAHSLFVSDKAPEGKEIIEVWTGFATSQLREMRETGTIDIANEAIFQYMKDNIPGFEDALEWALFPAFDFVVSAAPTPAQAWDGQIEPECPGISGLFFVGDSVRNYGSFMDGVAYTALLCADAITGKDYLEQVLPPYQREI
jgi:phytoene dehydrogenase-like protein